MKEIQALSIESSDLAGEESKGREGKTPQKAIARTRLPTLL